MPEITMCCGTDCPYKEKCYRFTAEKNDYQLFFLVPPIENDKCDFYWGENAQYIWSQFKEENK